MLENMFPRHVLEFIVGAAAPDTNLGELAYQHEDVSKISPLHALTDSGGRHVRTNDSGLTITVSSSSSLNTFYIWL